MLGPAVAEALSFRGPRVPPQTFDDIDVPGSPSQGKAKGVASSASKGSAIPSTLKLTKSAPSPPGGCLAML